MIDQDLKRKLAQALGLQMFFSPKDGAPATGENRGPLFEKVFQGLALMNRLEQIVTHSFQTFAARNTQVEAFEPTTEEAHSAGPAYTQAATSSTSPNHQAHLSRQTLIQKRINDSNRRMTQALLDLARKHMKSKTLTPPSSDFSSGDVPHYSIHETEVKRTGYFSKSTQTTPIFRPTRKG